ncbi:hypothetical protein HMPREF3226_02839 [Prevotella corporis]|uniref:Uncharacterized protein n=1 Tax=Prevotella corporis TaxID=28128 RepID=A0A133PSZ6_9BACT|nr:hypothetical protein HMPREF3226_02839 [Prevotella corporis]
MNKDCIDKDSSNGVLVADFFCTFVSENLSRGHFPSHTKENET